MSLKYPNQKTVAFLRENGLLLYKDDNNGNRIIMFRHGRTDANDKMVICGSGELSFYTPLNIIGIGQAEAQQETLKALLQGTSSADVIALSSPQPRAVDTAEVVTEFLNIPVKKVDFLKEITVGIFEGKPYAANPPAPDEYATFQEGGDSYLELCERIRAGLKDVLGTNKNKTILLSTHGTTGSIINQMMGNPYVSLGNVAMLEYNKRLELHCMHTNPRTVGLHPII